MQGHYTKSNFCVNDGIIIENLFVPSARTTNYGLKQLNGHRIRDELPTYLKNATSFNVFLKNVKVYYTYNHYTYMFVFSLPQPLFQFSCLLIIKIKFIIIIINIINIINIFL